MIRGGSDPPAFHGSNAAGENGSCLRGASPLMRMTASWFRSSGICRIQGCGARSPRPPLGRLASIVLPCLLLANASADYSAVDPDVPEPAAVLGPGQGVGLETPTRIERLSDGHP